MVSPSKPTRGAAAALLAVLLAMPPALTLVLPAEALARAGASGGYARPSVRTPSVGPPSSGGYRRPSVADGSLAAPRGGADLELSRRGSAEALERYRLSQQPRRPSTAPPQDWGTRRGTYYPPPTSMPSPSPGFGSVGNAVMLWFLLDTLGRPGRAEYFHDHADDPGYRAWRQEAEARARSDPELRAKLGQLDSEMAQRQGQPRDPTAPPPREPTGGGSAVLVVLLLVAMFGALWMARRKRAKGPANLASGMARAKLGLEPAPASPYRLGMTLIVDPAPFVLAGSAIKATPPAGTMTSVTALGTLDDLYDRLYLPDGFFQLHGRGGAVDECRWFSPLDQFTPADEQEWAFWLDPAQGLLGWPSFETKDGKRYDRAWSPGGQRVAPRAFSEQVASLGGTTARRLSMMLYAASTGVAAPGPEVEYVLVAAVEEGARAWVEVHAGIDVNPASLSLPT